MVALADPNHNSLYNRTFANLDAEELSERFPVTNRWVTVLYRPVVSTDENFQTAVAAYTPATTDPSYFMGIAVNAPAGISLTFDVECFTVFEYQGASVRGMTPSHVDVVGHAAIQASTTFNNSLGKPSTVPHKEMEKKVVKAAVKNVANSGSTSTSFLDKAADFVVSKGGEILGDALDWLGDAALAAFAL